MRVLLAARSLDPDRTSGGIGTCRMVRALGDAGHEVVCLTDDWSLPFEGRECRVDWLPGVRILNVYERAGIDGTGTPREDYVGSRGGVWRRLETRVWNFATGHDRRFWRTIRRWGEALARAVERERPDVILTRGTGLGFEPHIALSRIGDRIPWIANYHDPYPLSLYPPPYANGRFPVAFWQRHWHERILDRAPALTFPSDRLRRWVLGHRHAHKLPRAFVLPHVAAPEPVANGEPPVRLEKPFLLVHTGTLLAQRDPRGFLRAFARFLGEDAERGNDACCVLVGRIDTRHGFDSDQAVRRLSDDGNLLVIRDRVSHREALGIARRATALMVLEAAAESSPFLPGKMADYVALDKPILALSPAASAVMDLLGSDWPLHAHPEDEPGIRALLDMLWIAWKDGDLDRYRPSPIAAEGVSPESAVAAFERAADAAREACR